MNYMSSKFGFHIIYLLISFTLSLTSAHGQINFVWNLFNLEFIHFLKQIWDSFVFSSEFPFTNITIMDRDFPVFIVYTSLADE
jgi:hypothetical protein